MWERACSRCGQLGPQTLRVYEPLLAVAVIYIVLAFVIEHVFSRWGKVPQRQA